jgi:hypothetical protein
VYGYSLVTDADSVLSQYAIGSAAALDGHLRHPE